MPRGHSDGSHKPRTSASGGGGPVMGPGFIYADEDTAAEAKVAAAAAAAERTAAALAHEDSCCTPCGYVDPHPRLTGIGI